MAYALAVTFALFLWWFSTGAVLYIVGLPRRTLGRSMLVASAVGILALIGVAASASQATTLGAYCAFTCALLVWAWHEFSFLTGLVTGPRTAPCPAGATGWPRFSYSAQTLLYHEAAILLTAALLVALTWGAPNQIALWTFLILWFMRLSTKFNIFLGVPNLTEEFLPEVLAFLKSYFRKRPMNLLFPVSVTAATIATWMLLGVTIEATSGFAVAGFTMLTALMALAVIEHWFLVLPLPVERLWRWGLASRTSLSGREDVKKDDSGGLTHSGPAWAKTAAERDAPLISIPGR